MIRTSTMDTPDGPFTILMEADHVVASGWAVDPAALIPLIHPDLRPTRIVEGDDDAMQLAWAAVSAHYDGDVEAIATVPVRQRSGEFRMKAWEVLRNVPAGQPITYTEFASRTGSPRAIRAAAAACARNAAALFVPCHRVLRTDGSLGGFRYGLELKQHLLDIEAGALARQPVRAWAPNLDTRVAGRNRYQRGPHQPARG